MKKTDYAALAAIISKHTAAMQRVVIETDNYAALRVSSARKSMCEDIARDFARAASVDKTAFLKACGIEK